MISMAYGITEPSMCTELMKTCTIFTLLLTLSIGSAATAEQATLEDLFNQQQYVVFLQQAQQQAKIKNANALFLLGKAYHLGQGVTQDDPTARQYYEQARALGSARASHNLGVMALDEDRKTEAIFFLEEALARGLAIPTLSDLGRAHSPTEPIDMTAVKAAQRAGSYFSQAFALQPDNRDHLLNASREYLRVYLIARKMPFNTESNLDLRQQAIKWLKLGIAADEGVAWTNYGVLLLEENDYSGAKTAFLQGFKRQVDVASYYLGQMEERGLGSATNKAQALVYYEKAALMGMKQAQAPASQLLEEQLNCEDDIAKLEQGISRLRKIKQENYYRASLYSIEHRLAWGRFLAQQRKNTILPPIGAKTQLTLQACGLGYDQTHGELYNLGENTTWRMAAYLTLAEKITLPFEGLVDEQGCASLNIAMTDQLHRLLQQNAVFGLIFPNHTLPLVLIQKEDTLQLNIMPVGTPLAPKSCYSSSPSPLR